MLISFKHIVSEDFNVFLELPTKTISRFYKYDIISTSWSGKKNKFYVKELGSKYIFTLLYFF